ncbi:MAG TPA: MoaD/ThiS family protein [Nitrososphaerales archaeon]|nr:MoaD/ThiS family protein [Nitrososphaerales archaeon]
MNEDFASVKLLGNLSKSSDGKKVSTLTVNVPIKLSKLIAVMNERHGLEIARENVLILVNGVEANALEDLDTIVGSTDQVVFIPMFHGGRIA